jgi:hypothetical protein
MQKCGQSAPAVRLAVLYFRIATLPLPPNLAA